MVDSHKIKRNDLSSGDDLLIFFLSLPICDHLDPQKKVMQKHFNAVFSFNQLLETELVQRELLSFNIIIIINK